VGTAWEWNREDVPVQNSNCCALMKMAMVVVMIVMMEIVLMILRTLVEYVHLVVQDLSGG